MFDARLRPLIDPPLDREEIQAWVAYARQRHTGTFDMPTLHDRIAEYYTDIREQSKDTGAPVNLRKVGSILRYALASARIHLGDTVTDEDIDITKTRSEIVTDIQRSTESD